MRAVDRLHPYRPEVIFSPPPPPPDPGTPLFILRAVTRYTPFLPYARTLGSGVVAPPNDPNRDQGLYMIKTYPHSNDIRKITRQQPKFLNRPSRFIPPESLLTSHLRGRINKSFPAPMRVLRDKARRSRLSMTPFDTLTLPTIGRTVLSAIRSDSFVLARRRNRGSAKIFSHPIQPPPILGATGNPLILNGL